MFPLPIMRKEVLKEGMPTEIEDVLSRYGEIQVQEQALKAEKALLQDRIAAYMERTEKAVWFPVVGSQRLKVRYRKTVVVEYDEETLRRRLGPRYESILAPDLRKIRQHLPELQATLVPFMPMIGSPSADRVRDAIQEGAMKAEEFSGAFRKTTRRFVAVGRVQPQDASQENMGKGQDLMDSGSR